MNGPARAIRVVAPALIVASALVVAGCTGGSVNTTPVPTPTPSASSVTTTAAVPTSAGTVTLPTVAGQAATLGFAAGAPSGVTITATSSTTAPSVAPAPSSIKRAPEAISGAVPFFFVVFTVSASLPAQYLTDELVSLTSADPTTASYYAEFDDITSSPATKIASFGPGTVASGVVTITNTATGTVTNPTLTTGHTYLLQFYYVPAAGSPSATPTAAPSSSASPTASPTASPSGSASATPSPAPSSSASAAPSSSPSASPSSSPSASPSASASPSPLPSVTPVPAYTFSGGSDNTGTCGPTTSVCPIYIPVNNTALTFQAEFADANPQTNVTVSAATGSSQVTPSGFPFYTGTGTPIVYVEISATVDANFAFSLQIQLSGITGTYTSCIFYGYNNNSGSGFAWTQTIPATGSAAFSSGQVTFSPAALSGGVTININPFYGAIVCQ